MVLCYFDFGGMYTEFLIFLGGGEVKMGSVKEGNGSSSSAQGAPNWLFMIPFLSYQLKLVYIWDKGELVTR